MWVKVKGIVASLGDVLALGRTIFGLNYIDLCVPTMIALGKQHDIVKGRIEEIQVTDGLQASIFVAQYYASVFIYILLSTARDDGGHVVGSGQVVSTGIVPWLHHYGHMDISLQLWRSLLHDLIGPACTKELKDFLQSTCLEGLP